MTHFSSAKWGETPFGERLEFEMPAGCNVIIIGVMKHQLVPVGVLLPGQAYRETIGQILSEHGASEICLIPYHSADILSYRIPHIRDEFEAKRASALTGKEG